MGNPEGDPATKIDVGFRQPVIELEWSQDAEHNSRDLRDLQPMYGWAMPAKSCNQASTSSTISTSSDYESSLSQQASVEAGVDTAFASGAFKASAGMNSFKKDVLDSDSYRFEMISYCLIYKAGLNKPENLTKPGYKPVSEFAKRAQELPTLTHDTHCAGTMVPAPYRAPSSTGTCAVKAAGTNANCAAATTSATCTTASTAGGVTGAGNKCVFTSNPSDAVLSMDGTAAPASTPTASATATASNESNRTQAMICNDGDAYQKWERFFKDFGTHFIHYIEAGGKMIFQIDVTSSSITSSTKNEAEVALEIEGEYGPSTGAASVAVATANAATTSNSNTKKKVKAIILGGTPPGDPKTGFGEWAASVPDAPMPVKYKFLPLYYAGSAHVDRETYKVMANRYKAAVISGNVMPDSKITDRKPAYLSGTSKDEFFVSTAAGYLDSERNVLKIESDGRITITSRQGT